MAGSLHPMRFPGESDEYRDARDELLEAEIDLRRRSEEVAAQRRRLPLGGLLAEDYVFEEGPRDVGASETVTPVRFSQLFESALNVFVRRGDRIHHFYNAELLYASHPEGQDGRHVDPIWPLWNLFDFTPEGRGTDWYPKLKY